MGVATIRIRPIWASRAFLRPMKRFLVSALLLASAGLALAQDLGAAWFIERGRSQPVAFVQVGKVSKPLGLDFELDVSLLVRPLDGVRLGGAVTISTPIARNAWATLGIGGLVGETFEWSSMRPGLVFGVQMRF